MLVTLYAQIAAHLRTPPLQKSRTVGGDGLPKNESEPAMRASQKQEYVVDSRGRKRAVVLDIKAYRELLEDLEDLRLLAERKDETTSSLEEVEKRLRARGLL